MLADKVTTRDGAPGLPSLPVVARVLRSGQPRSSAADFGGDITDRVTASRACQLGVLRLMGRIGTAVQADHPRLCSAQLVLTVSVLISSGMGKAGPSRTTITGGTASRALSPRAPRAPTSVLRRGLCRGPVARSGQDGAGHGHSRGATRWCCRRRPKEGCWWSVLGVPGPHAPHGGGCDREAAARANQAVERHHEWMAGCPAPAWRGAFPANRVVGGRV